MLFDPKWEVKADPLSLESLIAWLEHQPSDTVYCYVSHGRCLLGQYLSAMGFEDPEVYSDCVFFHGPADSREMLRYPPKLNDIALWGGKTFGAALERARAEL